MEYGFFHEAEAVYLRSDVTRLCSVIHSILEKLGYTLHEDVYSLDRPGRLPPWQAEALVDVYVMKGESEVYDPSETWDTVKLVYLLATQPSDGIATFVESVSQVSHLLGIPITYGGRVISAQQLKEALIECADDLRRNLGEPGTESVAIFIESTYPRKVGN